MPPKKARAARRTPSGQALTDLILMVFKANVDLVDAGPLIVRDQTMSSMRWQMLNALEEESKTAAQLGREIGITRQGALLNVQSLLDLGYVTLNDNAEDQRAKKVVLTPAGAAKLHEMNDYQATWANQLGTHFDKEQLDVALGVVSKLRLLTLTSVSIADERAPRSVRASPRDTRGRAKEAR
jgi:DNA-binding MarR family transcriptional regulator